MSDPVSAALLSGGLKAGGSLIEWGLNRLGQKEAWAREDSAVQRRAKDMEAAGINPVMAAGSPAQSSPAVRMDMDTGDPVGAALESMKTKQDIAYSEAQRQKVLADTRVANAQAHMWEAEYEDKEKPGEKWSYGELQAAKIYEEVAAANLKRGKEKVSWDADWYGAKVREARNKFVLEHSAEINDLELQMSRYGASQEEIRLAINEMVRDRAEKDLKLYGLDKAFSYGAQLLGGAARAGMAYSGVTSGILNTAKTLTPSEFYGR